MEIFPTFLSSRRKVYGGSGLRSRLSFRVRIFREARFTALPRSDLNFRSLGRGRRSFWNRSPVLSLPIELLFMKIELSSPRFPSTIYHNFIVPKYYYSLLSYSLRRVYFFYSNLSTRPYHARPSSFFLSYYYFLLILSQRDLLCRTFRENRCQIFPSRSLDWLRI